MAKGSTPPPKKSSSNSNSNSHSRPSGYFWTALAFLVAAITIWHARTLEKRFTNAWSIEPVAFHPSSSPPSVVNDNGELARNSPAISRFAVGNVDGPETVFFNHEGKLFAPSGDGNILAVHPDGTTSPYVYVGGRPLSGKFASNGDLYVAESVKGLLKVDHATKEVTIVCSKTVDGRVVAFADDLDVASNGKVYFSDASRLPPLPLAFGFDLMVPSSLEGLEGRRSGRLVEYDPETKTCRAIKDNLAFGNGVTLSVNEDYVLIAETFARQIWRVWLKGDKTGQSEIFASDLPGYPDGVKRVQGTKDQFWVAIPLQASVFDTIAPFPWLKKILSYIPIPFDPYGQALLLDSNGKIIQNLSDTKGEYTNFITSVVDHDNKLYLGSFHNFITVFDKTKSKLTF